MIDRTRPHLSSSSHSLRLRTPQLIGRSIRQHSSPHMCLGIVLRASILLGVLITCASADVGTAQGQGAVDFSRVFTEAAVDNAPRLIDWPTRPAIPTLDTTAASGVVTVQFVVDTLGRIEPGTLTILSLPDSTLRTPTIVLLAALRFRTGEVVDEHRVRLVRVLVRRELTLHPGGFVLAGPRDKTIVRW